MSNDTPPTEEIPATAEPTRGISGDVKVQQIPLGKIQLDNHTFMFRAQLRVGDLKESIATEGLQAPGWRRSTPPMVLALRPAVTAVGTAWPCHPEAPRAHDEANGASTGI
jgi:hypothetical protein